MNPLDLHLGRNRAVIDAAHGGRLAGLLVDGRQLIAGDATDPNPLHWGSYPMVPWAGRIRRGRFSFAGVDHVLPINMAPHAIHGTGFTRPWTVTHAGSLAVELEAQLSAPDRGDWPFGGIARQRFELEADSLTCWLEIHAETPMPASLGWHPWFVKPDSIEFSPSAMYVRDDDYVTIARTVAPGPPPWDDCFTDVPQPVVLRWDDFELQITSSCDHWVVFDMPEHATCVEPQSGPPDALNIAPRVVMPGDPLVHWMRLGWAV